MNRAQRLALVAAALLAMSPVVAGQTDGPPTAERDAAEQMLRGAFTADRTHDNLTEFHELATNVSDEVAIMESFPEQFAVGNLTRAECGRLRGELADKPYVARLSDCQPVDDDPGEGDVTHTPGMPVRNGTRHVSFERVPGHMALTDYLVGDLRILDRLEYIGPADQDVQAHDIGNVRIIRVGDDRITLQDGPTGLVSFKGGPDGIGALLLDLPDGADIDRNSEGRGIVIDFGEREAILIAEDAHWTPPDVVEVTGFVSYHLRPAQPDLPSRPDTPGTRQAAEASERLTQAIVDRKVGAQVDVMPGASSLTAGGVEIQTFDDVEVAVQGSGGPATTDDPLRIEVTAELEEGRTFVTNIPRTLLVGPDLELRAFIVHDDGTDTEILLKQADDIEDILDASDDGGDMEYWVVEDANGIQLLFSVGHFSTHAITVASFGEVITQPSVMVGILVGIVGTAGAVAAMMWPRRR